MFFLFQLTEIQNVAEVKLNVLTALKLNILMETFFLDISNLRFLFYIIKKIISLKAPSDLMHIALFLFSHNGKMEKFVPRNGEFSLNV